MTTEELVKKYCNGKDDQKLFNTIVYYLNIIYDMPFENLKYELTESKGEFDSLDIQEIVNEFINKADYNSIDFNDILEQMNKYENCDYYFDNGIYYVFDTSEEGYIPRELWDIMIPYLNSIGYIHDEDGMYYKDQETYDDFEFVNDYASDFSSGIDLYDLTQYLNDNDIEISFKEKLQGIFSLYYNDKFICDFDTQKPIYHKKDAEAILNKIKSIM